MRLSKEDFEESLKLTVAGFNSKIAIEVRTRYRDIVKKYYTNEKLPPKPTASEILDYQNYTISLLQMVFYNPSLLLDLRNIFQNTPNTEYVYSSSYFLFHDTQYKLVF